MHKVFWFPFPWATSLSVINFSPLTVCVWGTSPSQAWGTFSNPDSACFVQVKNLIHSGLDSAHPSLSAIDALAVCSPRDLPDVPAVFPTVTFPHLLTSLIFLPLFLWEIFTLWSVPNTNTATVFITIHILKNLFSPNQHLSLSLAPFSFWRKWDH